MDYAPSRSLRQIGLILALLLVAAVPLLAEAPPPAAPLVSAPAVTPATPAPDALPGLETPAPIPAGGGGGFCDPEHQCDDCTACCIEWGGSGGICAGGTTCFCWW